MGGPGAHPQEMRAKRDVGLREKTQGLGSFNNKVFISLVLGSRRAKINKTQGSQPRVR